jgi:hypothetical protein
MLLALAGVQTTMEQGVIRNMPFSSHLRDTKQSQEIGRSFLVTTSAKV